MKPIIVATLLLASAVASAAMPAATIEVQFAEFKQKYNKKYNTAAEEAHRFAVFADNMKRAEKLNRANPLATFGAGVFADLSPEEFKQYHHANKKPLHLLQKENKKNNNTNNKNMRKRVASCAKVDYREQEAVTPVLDQGSCTSWSFATIANIESQWKLASPHHNLTVLSVQEFLSCWPGGGCMSNGAQDALKWFTNQRNGEVVSNAAFPYKEGLSPPCPGNLDTLPLGAVITGFEVLPPFEDQQAAWMCENGPFIVGVDSTSWQTYMGGIMTDCISSQVDHGALAVGFDDNHNPPYWIVKNSWGTSWGENGYIRLEKGTNQCLFSTSTMFASASPGPLPPPTPKPGPGLLQRSCEDKKCTALCFNYTYPLHTCLRLPNGVSINVTSCNKTAVTVEQYPTTDCSGTATTEDMPLNECLHDKNGDYFENFCVSAVQSYSSSLQHLKSRKM